MLRTRQSSVSLGAARGSVVGNWGQRTKRLSALKVPLCDGGSSGACRRIWKVTMKKKCIV